MVVGPGMAGASVTVLLGEDEKLPKHLNKRGILAFRVQNTPVRKWTVVKTPDFVMPEDELSLDIPAQEV